MRLHPLGSCDQLWNPLLQDAISFLTRNNILYSATLPQKMKTTMDNMALVQAVLVSNMTALQAQLEVEVRACIFNINHMRYYIAE